MTVTMDLDKTFDRLEWEFIQNVLQTLDFVINRYTGSYNAS